MLQQVNARLKHAVERLDFPCAKPADLPPVHVGEHLVVHPVLDPQALMQLEIAQFGNQRADPRLDLMRRIAHVLVGEKGPPAAVPLQVPAQQFHAGDDMPRGRGGEVAAEADGLPGLVSANPFAHGVGVAHHEQEAGVRKVPRELVHMQQEMRRLGVEHGGGGVAGECLEVPGLAYARPVVGIRVGQTAPPVGLAPDQPAVLERGGPGEAERELAFPRQVPGRLAGRHRLLEETGAAVVRRDAEKVRANGALQVVHRPVRRAHGGGAPGLDRAGEVQHLRVLRRQPLVRQNRLPHVQRIVVGRTDQAVPSREVLVQQELVVGVDRVRPAPGIRRDPAQQLRVGALAREALVDKQKPRIERPLQCAPGSGTGGAGKRLERDGIAALSRQGHEVAAADQRLPAVEEFPDRAAEQEVAVAIEHLAVAGDAERLQAVEAGKPPPLRQWPAGEGGQAASQRGAHRLRPQRRTGPRQRREVLGGQSVVEQQHPAAKAGMLLKK